MSRIIEVVPRAFADVPVLAPPPALWCWLGLTFGVVSWDWFRLEGRRN